MNRKDQTGANAPSRGTALRISTTGKVSIDIKALEKFPAPDSLTSLQKSLWNAALADVSFKFFRARHIPIMMQYVTAVENMMTLGVQLSYEPGNKKLLKSWMMYIQIVTKLERFLSFDTSTLISIRMKARAEMKQEYDTEEQAEFAVLDDNPRAGLSYVQP